MRGSERPLSPSRCGGSCALASEQVCLTHSVGSAPSTHERETGYHHQQSATRKRAVRSSNATSATVAAGSRSFRAAGLG